MSRGLLFASSLALVLLSGVTVARADVFDDNNCGDRLVLCLTIKGKPEKPAHTTRFYLGEAVHVLIFGEALPDGSTVTIDTSAVSRGDSVLQQTATTTPPADPAAAARQQAAIAKAADAVKKATDEDNAATTNKAAADKDAADKAAEAAKAAADAKTAADKATAAKAATAGAVLAPAPDRAAKVDALAPNTAAAEKLAAAAKEKADAAADTAAKATLAKKNAEGAAAAKAKTAAQKAEAEMAAATAAQTVLANRIVTIPSADELQLTITVTQVNATPDGGTETLQIADSLYIARPALAFVWVDQGSRTISPEHTPISSTASFPGVALQVWPWGHRNRALSGLEHWAGWRSVGDMVSLQIGTDLDFTKPFDRGFLGLTLEPISGLGISGGIATTMGQYFSGAPASSTMAVVDQRMWRPYVSVTLSSELFNTLKTLASSQTESSH